MGADILTLLRDLVGDGESCPTSQEYCSDCRNDHDHCFYCEQRVSAWSGACSHNVDCAWLRAKEFLASLNPS